MSLERVQQVKKDKGFKLRDLFLYGAILIVIVVTLIAVILTVDTSPLKGIRVFVKNDVVFEYDFTKDEYKVSDAAAVAVEESGNQLYVTVTCGDGYNKIEIDKSGRVSVTEADCHSKTCVAMSDIKDNSSFIFCSPHGLRIMPYNFTSGSEVPIG